MLDPISAAGLALAVFDQLLKLSAKTAEVVAEMRSFDDDFRQIRHTIRFQIWRMDGLRLLFRQSSIYGDESLIQKFDLDAQEQIRNDLDELCMILERVLKSLKRISIPASVTESNGANEASWSSETLLPSNSTSGRGKSPIQLLKWSFRDKKDLANTVEQFTRVNDRLSEMVRFWSLASDIGVDLRHLQHLRSDEDAVTLGCSDDASLALAVSDTGHISDSFELDISWHTTLREAKRIEDRFASFDWKGTHILQENCAYTPQEDDSIDPQSRNRINLLAELLHQPKEQLFCILACQGWGYVPKSKQISYIFQIPPSVIPDPKSLLQLLNNHSTQPSLGVKFHLAHNLARCVAQLHMVKWVHESFHSENILFFQQSPDSSRDAKPKPTEERVDMRQPWIFGFEFSRPDSYFSNGVVDACPERDVYRHPERQGLPVTTFKKIHDIYALGVVLLEIGVWRPAITLEKHRFAHAKDSKGHPCGITQHLIKHAQKNLENPMGQKYRDIVLRCLTGKFGVVDDNKEDFKLQRAFRAQILEPLRKMAEAV